MLAAATPAFAGGVTVAEEGESKLKLGACRTYEKSTARQG